MRPSNLKWETNIEGTFVLCNIKCLKRRVEKIHTLSKYVPNPDAGTMGRFLCSDQILISMGPRAGCSDPRILRNASH